MTAAAVTQGTESNPYIISTWKEFLQHCNEENKYIKFDKTTNSISTISSNQETTDDTTIDLNDEESWGLEEEVTIKAHVNGNGWTIKNLYLLSHPFQISNSAKIIQLNFQNIIIDSKSASYIFQCEDGVANSTLGTFEKCKFSGIIMGGAAIASKLEFKGCSFNFLLTNFQENSFLFEQSEVDYCRFDFTDISTNKWKLSNGSSSTQTNYKNVLFQGTISTPSFFSDASIFASCIFDFKFNLADGVATVTQPFVNEKENCIFNTSEDKINGKLTATSNLISVAEEDLKNAETLCTKGFICIDVSEENE